MRCPFPDCSAQKSTATNDTPRTDHIADGVYLCRDCGRLVFKCVASDCQKALNRPFSRFCRHCGKTQYPSNGITGSNRWEEVQRFDFDWSFTAAASEGLSQLHGDVLPIEQHDLCHLDEVKGFRPPKVLIELAFIDGLLAIHQGGGFFALVHPFRDGTENTDLKPVLWSQSEQELCKLPNAYDDDSNVFRPFAPIATADRQFAIFSTPYAVYAVQPGTLPGWNYQAETKSSLVWSTNSLSEQRLAATPVLMNNPRVESSNEPAAEVERVQNQLGLLLFNPKTQLYSWLVTGLRSSQSKLDEAATTERQQEPIPLPIIGNPVQILSFQDQFLVFATSVGHSIWSTHDACQMNSSTMFHVTATSDKNDMMLLDAEIEDRGVFSWHHQHVVTSQDNSFSKWGLRSHDSLFELCFMRKHKGGKITVDYRKIWPTNPTNTKSALTQQIDFFGMSARTLGNCVSIDDAREREMLFLVDSTGHLYRRPFTGADPKSIGNIQSGEMSTISGFQIFDPLLGAVRQDPSNRSLQTVELRSIRHAQRTAIARGLALKADPLPWSNYLFTCEQKNNHVSVIRRRYSIEPVD